MSLLRPVGGAWRGRWGRKINPELPEPPPRAPPPPPPSTCASASNEGVEEVEVSRKRKSRERQHGSAARSPAVLCCVMAPGEARPQGVGIGGGSPCRRSATPGAVRCLHATKSNVYSYPRNSWLTDWELLEPHRRSDFIARRLSRVTAGWRRYFPPISVSMC